MTCGRNVLSSGSAFHCSIVLLFVDERLDSTEAKIKVVIVYSDPNNSRNVTDRRGCSIASFCSGFRMYVLPEKLRILSKSRQKLFRFLSQRLLSLCHNGRWSGSCHAQISVDHPLHISQRPMGILPLSEQSKIAGWGAFPAGLSFPPHSPHSPLRPLCTATHFPLSKPERRGCTQATCPVGRYRPELILPWWCIHATGMGFTN